MPFFLLFHITVIVQVSDTTMLSSVHLLVKKSTFEIPMYFGAQLNTSTSLSTTASQTNQFLIRYFLFLIVKKVYILNRLMENKVLVRW